MAEGLGTTVTQQQIIRCLVAVGERGYVQEHQQRSQLLGLILALIGVNQHLVFSFSVLYIYLAANVSHNHSGLCVVGKMHGPMSPLAHIS